MEGSIAMDMARTAIQEPVAQVGLEEARLEAVRATLKQVKNKFTFLPHQDLEPIRIILIFWASASRSTGSLNKKSACKNSTGSS